MTWEYLARETFSSVVNLFDKISPNALLDKISSNTLLDKISSNNLFDKLSSNVLNMTRSICLGFIIHTWFSFVECLNMTNSIK